MPLLLHSTVLLVSIYNYMWKIFPFSCKNHNYCDYGSKFCECGNKAMSKIAKFANTNH